MLSAPLLQLVLNERLPPPKLYHLRVLLHKVMLLVQQHRPRTNLHVLLLINRLTALRLVLMLSILAKAPLPPIQHPMHPSQCLSHSREKVKVLIRKD